MRPDVIGVGVVGANPDRGWAARSHLPAIVAQPDLRLTAVATTRIETARAAADRFGADRAFDSAAELIDCPDVEVVVVAVRVPYHRALVTAAAEAGKQVYCEWPLGVDLDETEHLAATARVAGVRTAIGLQARSAPELRLLRDVVDSGGIGAVVSCSATAYSARGSDPVTASKRYLFDASTGANLLTIETGHLLDAVAFVTGEPAHLRGYARTRRPEVATTDGGTLVNTTPDSVVACWVTANGAPVAISVSQGTHAVETTELTVVGTAGALRLVTTAPGGIQMAPAKLFRSAGNRPFAHFDVPTAYRRAVDPGVSTAVNVAEALSAFADELRSETRSVPDFDDAVVRHESLAIIDW
jgi:predicted dehydrogenase